MLFQGKDGELRINDHGLSGTTYYLEVLFCDMNFSGPIARPRSEEKLTMNRGMMDTNAFFLQGNDEPIYAAIPMSFSCRLADTSASTCALDFFSGVTIIRGHTLYSRDGYATIRGNTVPAFADSGKMAYTVEVLWDGTQDIGYQYDAVFFQPGDVTITESPDGLTMNVTGQIFGGVSRITGFTSGYTNLVTG